MGPVASDGINGYSDGMIRMQIQFEEEQAKRLRALAAARRLSIAAIVREAVDAYRPSTLTEDEKWKRALAVLGKFSSGVGDLSVNHDGYFGEEHDR